MTAYIATFPDAEVELFAVLASQFTSYRWSTKLPGTFTGIAIRIHRISGANRDIAVDRPIVDIDVFSTTGEADASTAARAIQASIIGLQGKRTPNGVIQMARTVNGPRWMPDSNQTVIRYGATYELYIRAAS